MARGPRKHLKRLAAPKHWMLHKLGGIFAPRPRPGPHKLRECLPLVLLLRNRLKYALNAKEATAILSTRAVKVDGKVRTDGKFPAGFMDVVEIPKAGERFRLLYDTKGRFLLHRITPQETNFKVCQVAKLYHKKRATPYLSTHDGRVIRFPDPSIKPYDSIVLDLATNKIKDWVKFRSGAMVMVTGGKNIGRIGTIVRREFRAGTLDTVQIRDLVGHSFNTRISYCFVIGDNAQKPLISLPKGKGVKVSQVVDRERRLARVGHRKKSTQQIQSRRNNKRLHRKRREAARTEKRSGKQSEAAEKPAKKAKATPKAKASKAAKPAAKASKKK